MQSCVLAAPLCCVMQMRKSAMESALQHEVTAHAAVRAHHGLLQECLNNLVANLQQQHTGRQQHLVGALLLLLHVQHTQSYVMHGICATPRGAVLQT